MHSLCVVCGLRLKRLVHCDVGKRHNTYIAPQVATAAAEALFCQTVDMQPIGCRLSPHTRASSLTARQPHVQPWSVV